MRVRRFSGQPYRWDAPALHASDSDRAHTLLLVLCFYVSLVELYVYTVSQV